MQGMDTFAPLSRVKSYPESYPIPSTVKLSSTSPNDSYPDRSPPPPYSLPPPPITAPLIPAPPVTQAIAPVVQANVASVTIPTAPPVVNPVALATAPVMMAGGPPDPLPPPPPGSEPGSAADFDNMSVTRSSHLLSILSMGVHTLSTGPNWGFHLPDLTSLTGTVAYEMWKNTIGFFHLSGRTDELIMPIMYQSIKGMWH